MFYSFFQSFGFSGCQEGQRAKNCSKWQNILSIVPFILGTRHHMIFIYGTRVKKDNISRCFSHFFQVLIFRVNSGVKGQKMAQNDKKTLSVAPYILRTIHHMIFIYGTYVKMLIISWCFLQFLQVLIFGVNRG